MSFVNIEGDLTPFERFITDHAKKAIARGLDYFDLWFERDFIGGILLEWSRCWPSCARYVDALTQCSRNAFKANVEHIYALNPEEGSMDYQNPSEYFGSDYKALPVRKVFCWGECSLSSESKRYLEYAKIYHKPFPNAAHWVMLDQENTFYAYLAHFLE